MTREISLTTTPSLEEDRRLYQAVARVKELAPWEWMDEADIFGVQNPETGELGFVSIMGMAGEHFAAGVYLGAGALHGFWDMETGEEMAAMSMKLLEIPQLQASFENREQLHKQDREQIKKLGLKFRGAHAWPLFRSYRPGFMPWFVTAEEARFLACALEQTLAVAPRVQADPEVLVAKDDEDDEFYLVRVPRKAEDDLVWEDQVRRVPPPEPARIPVVLEVSQIAQLKQLPQPALTLEIDLNNMLMPIAERGERPALPYMLMFADARSGMILGFELLTVETSLADMHSLIPMKLAHWFTEAGVVPREIKVRSELLFLLLQPLTGTLGIRLTQVDHLPSLDAAMDGMSQMVGGMF